MEHIYFGKSDSTLLIETISISNCEKLQFLSSSGTTISNVFEIHNTPILGSSTLSLNEEISFSNLMILNSINSNKYVFDNIDTIKGVIILRNGFSDSAASVEILNMNELDVL